MLLQHAQPPYPHSPTPTTTTFPTPPSSAIPTLTFMEPLECGEASTSSQRRNGAAGGGGGVAQSVVGGEVGGGGADKGLMEEGEGRGARVGAPLKVARYGMEGKVSSHISPLLL